MRTFFIIIQSSRQGDYSPRPLTPPCVLSYLTGCEAAVSVEAEFFRSDADRFYEHCQVWREYKKMSEVFKTSDICRNS